MVEFWGRRLSSVRLWNTALGLASLIYKTKTKKQTLGKIWPMSRLEALV